MPRAELKTTLTAKGKLVGRPRKVVPCDAYARAEAAAKEGWSMKAIAWKLGASEDVMRRWMEEQPSLKEAIDRGRERERHELHSGLVTAAKKGNIVAAMFLLKSRHGYREGDQGDTANRVSITFNMPGALKPEQYTVENVSSTEPKRLPTAHSVRS